MYCTGCDEKRSLFGLFGMRGAQISNNCVCPQSIRVLGLRAIFYASGGVAFVLGQVHLTRPFRRYSYFIRLRVVSLFELACKTELLNIKKKLDLNHPINGLNDQKKN